MQEQNETLAAADAKGSGEECAVAVGQVWERPNGTRFSIERIDSCYAHYWLAEGSKPQYRSIALENFKRYRRVR